MDIGDRHQTYGRLVPKLAQSHPAISEALLHLAAASCVSDSSRVESSTGHLVFLQLNHVKQVEGVAYLIPMMSWILRKVENFIEDVPDGWDSFFSQGRISLLSSKFETPEYRIGWLASVGFMSRMGTFLRESACK